jgi:hypothetical protein
VGGEGQRLWQVPWIDIDRRIWGDGRRALLKCLPAAGRNTGLISCYHQRHDRLMSLVLQSAGIVSDELLIEVRLDGCGNAHVLNVTINGDRYNGRWRPNGISAHVPLLCAVSD